MKHIILIFCLIANILQAKDTKDRLYLFANSGAHQIELKWFTQKYSSKYTYKLYRNSKGDKPKFLGILKPESYEVLKKNGYSDDYIFMIYPYRNVKNFGDRIKIAKIEENVQAFRMLKLIRDEAFAKNLGQYFVDLNVKKDKIYLYTVEAYIGKKMIFQRSVFANTFNTPKKSDFMWTRAKQTSKGIELSWDVSQKFNYYNIYRKKVGEKRFVKLNPDLMFISREYAQKTRTLYTDKDIKPGESATYYVRRINMFGKEGIPSSHFKGEMKIAKKIKPKAVKNLFVTSTDKKIKIRWSKSYNVLGYNIYRSKIYEGNFRKINKKPIKKEVFFDKHFKVDKNYYYYVTAINMYGESKPSMVMLAYARDTTKPPTPVKLVAKVSPGLVSLKWNQVKDKNLAGYRVYVSMDEDAAHWSLVNKEVLKTNHYKHKRSKTLSRFPYYYRVSSVDKTFNESFPSKIIRVKLPDVTAPDQPFIKKFRAYANKITFEWNKIIVYDLDGYNVYRKTGKKITKLNKAILKNSMFTDTKPLQGANKYIVTAVDKSGNESDKKYSKVIYLKDIIPVKIENFKLSKIKDGIKASFACKDKDYAGFKLFRSSGKIIKYFNVSNFVKSKSYIDKSISKKTRYFYIIKAYDKAGNIAESKVKSIRVVKK